LFLAVLERAREAQRARDAVGDDVVVELPAARRALPERLLVAKVEVPQPAYFLLPLRWRLLLRG
jgi:hypothetical protein